jgi:UDP-N-acetylglucosamine acyltransferase
MADSNKIHPTAFVGPGVALGTGNVVGPYAVLLGPLLVGDDNWFGPHLCIGAPGEMRGGAHPASWLTVTADDPGIRIGSRNILREFLTVQQGVQTATVVGDDCYLMARTHVPHDAVLGNSVTMSTAAQIGGHTIVEDHANIGLGAQVHQKLFIGVGAMVGMGAIVTRPVPPFAIVMGSPARATRANGVGMRRAGFSPTDIDLVETRISLGHFPDGALPSTAIATAFEAYEAVMLRR